MACDFLGTDVAHSIYAIFGTYLILISAGNFPTLCPGSSNPFYIVTYYIKWVTTSLTHTIPRYLLRTCVPAYCWDMAFSP